MKIFLCICIYITLAFICIPSIIKKKHWGEVAVVSVILTAGFTLSLLQLLGVNVPNPNKGIESLINLLYSS